MATVKRFLNEIKSICECNICYVEYDEEKHVPRVLPCQHTVCTDCLIKHCRSHKLKCPFCNHEHNVRNGDVKGFPKDNTRRDLKELLEKFSQSLCGVCKQHDHVKYFCATCNIRLCRECYKKKKASNCNTHDIIDDSQDTPDTSLDSTENHPKSVCLLTGHEKNELKFFCSEKSCSTPVCANCIVESHKTHDIKAVKDEYANRLNCMQGSCKTTREKIASAKNLLEIVEKEYASLQDTDRRGKESLEAVANKGIEYINNYQESAKQQTHEMLQTNLNMLERRKEQLQNFIENATECCAISEEALTGNNAVAFLSVERTLTEKLNGFKQSDVDTPLDTIPKENLKLQIPIVQLQERINRMTREGHAINDDRRPWAIFFKEFEMPPCSTILAIVLAVIPLVLWLKPLPYALVFDTDRSYLAFDSSQTSLMCLTTDRRMASSTPMKNTKQTCGSKQSRYIFNGAFTSFVYGNGENFIYQIHVSEIKRYYPGQTLFEFGISKSSIDRRNILGPFSLDFYGWSLNILNKNREYTLINTEGRIVYAGVISVFDEDTFTFRVNLKPNRIVTLEIQNKNVKSYKKLDETRSIKGKKWGFVKSCYLSDAHVTILILNNNIAFNRSTLYPHLYISTNNKTISNKKAPSLLQKRIIKGSNYLDIMLLNCRDKCVYVLEFKVNSPHDHKILSMVLTNSQFLPSAYYNISLFSYVSCNVDGFFTGRSPSHCLSVDNELSSYLVEMKSNKWHSLTITVNRNRHSASFLLGGKVIEKQDGFIFESGTPILRLNVENMHDSVEIRLGDRQDYDILTWFLNYIISPYAANLLSWIPISRRYLQCIFFITLGFIFIKEQFDYYYMYVNDDRIELRADIIERRRRGRRRRL